MRKCLTSLTARPTVATVLKVSSSVTQLLEVQAPVWAPTFWKNSTTGPFKFFFVISKFFLYIWNHFDGHFSHMSGLASMFERCPRSSILYRPGGFPVGQLRVRALEAFVCSTCCNIYIYIYIYILYFTKR